MSENRGLDEVGDREGQERLHQEHVEAHLHQDRPEVGPGAEERREQVVVDQVLGAALVEPAVAEQSEIAFDAEGHLPSWWQRPAIIPSDILTRHRGALEGHELRKEIRRRRFECTFRARYDAFIVETE